MQIINLNILSGAIPPVAHCSQGDVGRQIDFAITDDGADYAIPTGAVVWVEGTKYDRHGFAYDSTNQPETVSYTGNVVTVLTTEQMTACAGKATCEIKIVSGSTTLYTLNFILDVEKMALPSDTDMSATDIPMIKKAIDAGQEIDDLSDKLNQAEKLVETMGEDVKAAATSADNASASATAAKNSQTQAASSATKAANQAKAAETSATAAANSANESDTYATEAESWAHGGTGTRTGEGTDNAKYYSEQSKASATESADSASASAKSATASATSEKNASDSAAAAAKSAQEAAGAVTGVATWNGRAGAVKPQSGDYTADMVGAMPVDRAATSSVLGGVKIGSNITNSSGTISITKANVTSALGYTPPTTNTTYSAATTSAAGLMSAADKTKLNGIATGANKYSLPTATSSVLGGVKIGSNITNSSGKISITKANVTSALGYTPPTTNTTYSAATTSAAGLMSAADKAEFDARPKSRKLAAQKLTASGGTLTFTDDAIGDDSMIDVYASIANIAPTSITQSGTTCTVSFDAQSSDFSVALIVYN